MDFLVTHCSALFSQQESIFITLFLAGIVGGFTHCLSMCGSFIACQSACAKSCATKKSSLGLSYHMGRAASYGALGFVAALCAKQIAATSWWPSVSALMLIGAGILFLISSVTACHHSLSTFSTSKWIFTRGALLGFLPCGLIYAALMIAATIANPWHAMIGMWLFVLGTIPALSITTITTHMLTQKWHRAMHIIGRTLMACNGLVLFVMAEKIVR